MRFLSNEDWIAKIGEFMSEITGRECSAFTLTTPLIGEGAALKSRELVELLLTIETYADEELGLKFDWASDSALSQRRSAFRTIGTLAEHLRQLGSHTIK